MLAAKVFENGRSQVVRLPKEYRFHCDELMVNKIGDVLILLPKNSKWDSFITAIDMFSDDFMIDREDKEFTRVPDLEVCNWVK